MPGVKESGEPSSPIELPWTLVPTELLADEVRPELVGQLHEMHSAFRALAEIQALLSLVGNPDPALKGSAAPGTQPAATLPPAPRTLDILTVLLASIRDLGKNKEKDVPLAKIKDLVPKEEQIAAIANALLRDKSSGNQRIVDLMIAYLRDRLEFYARTVAAASRVSQEVVSYYERKVRTLALDGVLPLPSRRV